MSVKTKSAGLRVRVEPELREEFVEICRTEGRPAAQVLRDFMRRYVSENRAAAQRELFATVPPPQV
jgi:Ribbon-helix-helix protein